MGETLEEASRKELFIADIEAFKRGAKWQQERSYSEEDLEKAYKGGSRNEYDFINKYHCKARITFEEWFEQFKKK